MLSDINEAAECNGYHSFLHDYITWIINSKQIDYDN